MAYLKPQSPLKNGEDHIYPLTTVDQIIMDDGKRLNNVGVYLEKPEDFTDATPETINADTLGGKAASEYLGVSDTAMNSLNSEKLGGKAPQYYIQPRNLLDNSDFRNPINQRGVTHVTNYGYTLDRWLMYAVNEGAEYSVTVNDGYISLVNAKFEQRIERYLPGVVYTAAAKKTDGSVVVCSGDFHSDAIIEGSIYLKTSSNGHAVFGITNGEYVWAVLYEGSYTAETLPPYVPKGYATELAECLRYYRKSYDGNSVTSYEKGAVIIRPANQNWLCSVNFDSPMRATPTVKVYSPVTKTEGKVMTWSTDTDISESVNIHASNRGFIITKAGVFNMDDAYCFHYTASADL